ncbi:MAG: V-type ATP synthase subunit E family protein [Clostridia bacterium]|nr:V-type ATP synthase subunit E family protein [Clostridia bacterium]
MYKMSGIDRIYDKIINDAKEQADKRLDEAKQKISVMKKAVKEQLDEKKQEQIELAEKEAENIIKRAVANRNLEGKKQLLSVKQKVISKVFETAHVELMNMPEDDLLKMYKNLIIGSLEKGKNEIMLNEDDAKAIGQKLIGLLEKDIDSNFRVSLSSHFIQDDKGVIVRNENIYSNSVFSSILKYKKQELETDIMKILFERNAK